MRDESDLEGFAAMNAAMDARDRQRAKECPYYSMHAPRVRDHDGTVECGATV
jgi:hypothetical protein